MSEDANEYKAGFGTMLILFLLSSILPLLFLLGFSGMGFGITVVKHSYEYQDEAGIVIQSTLLLMVFMYIFDSHFWPTVIRILVWCAIFVAFGVSMCLMVALTPYGPICVFTVLMPISFFGIQRSIWDVPTYIYVGWMYKVLMWMASLILVAFFIWDAFGGTATNAQSNNMWDSKTNAIYSAAAGCAVDFTDLEECKHANDNNNTELPCFFEDESMTQVSFQGATCSPHCLGVFKDCEEAFITWANPGLAAMALFVIGFISKYLQQPEEISHSHHQLSAVAKFASIVLFLLWIYASLAGGGEGLSSSLIAFAISMVIGAAIVFSAVFWNSLVNQTIISGPGHLVSNAAKHVESYMDLLKGLLILGFTPLVLAYLVLSVLNQFVRRFFTRHCLRNKMSDAEYEHAGCFTYAVTSQIKDFKSWNHSHVLSLAVYWGVAYVFLNVLAAKFTTVFLSWLIQYTSTMELLPVTGIVIGVGMVLFMLPPIPGLPIYLTGGIVLVSVGKDVLGLWGAIGYACLVSLFLKLLACSVQQKLIGEMLGGSIRVKQLVSINSDGIRAMRVMLSEKGITARKVAVLVGGPDWPVSVLCGVLGLDLFSILIGTLPVFSLIVPTVFTGSFAYMGSLESSDGIELYPWADTLGAVSSAIAGVAMFYFTLAAATAVKDTLANDQDIINEIPIDEAVALADAEDEKQLLVYRRVTVWENVPWILKACLIVAVLLMMGCCYLLVIFNSQCFREYDLMYTIAQHLGGKWTNIVLPLGRLALLLFVLSYALLYIFECWANIKTKAAVKQMDDGKEVEPLTATDIATYA